MELELLISMVILMEVGKGEGIGVEKGGGLEIEKRGGKVATGQVRGLRLEIEEGRDGLSKLSSLVEGRWRRKT